MIYLTENKNIKIIKIIIYNNLSYKNVFTTTIIISNKHHEIHF